MYDEHHLIKEALQYNRSQAEYRRHKNQLIKLAREHKKAREKHESNTTPRHLKWPLLPTLLAHLQRWKPIPQRQRTSLATGSCIEEPNPC